MPNYNHSCLCTVILHFFTESPFCSRTWTICCGFVCFPRRRALYTGSPSRASTAYFTSFPPDRTTLLQSSSVQQRWRSSQKLISVTGVSKTVYPGMAVLVVISEDEVKTKWKVVFKCNVFARTNRESYPQEKVYKSKEWPAKRMWKLPWLWHFPICPL